VYSRYLKNAYGKYPETTVEMTRHVMTRTRRLKLWWRVQEEHALGTTPASVIF
jgi:hypothetical protein